MTAADKFCQFAAEQMKAQGADIKRWAQDQNPQLAQLCRDIMQAADQATEAMR